MDNQQGKKAYLYEQDDVSYTPLSTRSGEACGGCRWFNDYVGEDVIGGKCQLIQSYPLPIRETGWCSEFDAIPEPKPDFNEVLEELAEVLETKEHKPNLLERVKALFSLHVKARDEPVGSGFKSLGNGQWVGWFSNNFKDRQREFFPAKATDEFISRFDRKEVPPPELYFWHVPYRLGEVKSIARVALDNSPNSPSFTVAIGTYDDTPIAKAFEKAMKDRLYPMSHGFHYAPAFKEGGAYNYYNTFEVSPLPPHAPANPYTLFEDGITMPLIGEDKRKEFVRLLGEDYVKEIETKAETNAKALQDAGVDYKDMKLIDTEARAQLDALTKEVKELTDAMKAKMTMGDDEDEDAKKKKAEADGAFKKEVNDAIRVLATSQSETVKSLKQLTEFMELTPRRASKSADNLVPPNDAALQELQKGMSGDKSNEDKILHSAFGFMNLGGLNNGS